MNEAEVNDMIQRWRDTPEDNLKEEDYQDFLDLGSACLTQGESAQLLQFLQDDRNQGIVKSMGCVLLSPLLCQIISKGKNCDYCQTVFTHLTETCSSQKLLHSLLELIKDTDPGAISKTIITLAPHLQTVVLGLDEGQAASLGVALSSLHQQLRHLPVPYTLQQEEEDQYGLYRCCAAMTTFTKPFVEKVKRASGKWVTTKEDEELRVELLKYCMRSLREPLLEVQLERGRTSLIWIFVNDIMVTLSSIQEPLPDILFFNSLRKYGLDNDHSLESRACLAFLLFVQLMSIDSLPAVFSPVFILQCNVEYVNQLLSSKNESYLLKGLALYSKSLEAAMDNSLPVNLLELSSFCSVSQKLCYILRECPIKHLKETGLQVFQLFIHKLDAEAKHKFFRCILKTSNHSGIEGFIVKNIRNEVEFFMKSGNENKWFLGVEMPSLLGLVLCLPQGPETDLLNNMDKIMESLNLLRFLLIRDKELKIHIEVWTELCRLKCEYLKGLRLCISLSRAYYSSEVKALQEDRKLKVKEARATPRDNTVAHKIKLKQDDISNISPEIQYQVLQSAMVTFDLMESLIFRIEEITENKI